MRVILYTGKGGVGKTSIAAATAIKCAELGYKTLLASADSAHSLGDSLDMALSSEPGLVLDNLYAQEIDATHELRKLWGTVKSYLTDILPKRYVNDISADELLVFPGLEELLNLSKMFNYYNNSDYDLIVIDCAPTGETLAMLSIPEMLCWWLDRIIEVRSTAVIVAGRISELPKTALRIINDMEKVCRYLEKMRLILTDRETTSIRIVTNPEKMAVSETRRSFSYLNVCGFNVDAIIVNKVIPDAVSDDYFRNWKDIQKNCIEMIKESFEPVPIYYAPWFEKETVGVDMHRRMAMEIFHEEDPAGIKYDKRTYEVIKTANGYTLSVYLPFADGGDFSINQKGDDFVIRVGNAKRNVMLPKFLADMSVSGAGFEKDTLNIRFV
jgi:arsenite-transporting ATPase